MRGFREIAISPIRRVFQSYCISITFSLSKRIAGIFMAETAAAAKKRILATSAF